MTSSPSVGLLTQLVDTALAAPVTQRSWVRLPHRPGFFPGFIFTTASVVRVHASDDYLHSHSDQLVSWAGAEVEHSKKAF